MSVMRERTAREHAARGAAWMDKHDPTWFRRINVEKLDIEYAPHCVIGQYEADRGGDFNTWHDYCSKKMSVRALNNFTISHGLCVRHENTENWQKQTKAWREQINDRLQHFQMSA